jgi:hypothetical protein
MTVNLVGARTAPQSDYDQNDRKYAHHTSGQVRRGNSLVHQGEHDDSGHHKANVNVHGWAA